MKRVLVFIFLSATIAYGGVINPGGGGTSSGGVTALTCGGTDKFSSVTGAGVFTCTTDQTSAGGGNVIGTSPTTTGALVTWNSITGTAVSQLTGTGNVIITNGVASVSSFPTFSYLLSDISASVLVTSYFTSLTFTATTQTARVNVEARINFDTSNVANTVSFAWDSMGGTQNLGNCHYLQPGAATANTGYTTRIEVSPSFSGATASHINQSSYQLISWCTYTNGAVPKGLRLRTRPEVNGTTVNIRKGSWVSWQEFQ